MYSTTDKPAEINEIKIKQFVVSNTESKNFSHNY